jgi:hypothetical protein
MMNTYTMDLIRLFADKHHFNANEAYDAFLNSLRNNNLSLSKTESNTEPAISEPALSEPALSEPAVVDTEKSANKGRPKKVKESIIENHEDEELENVNTVIKQLMESDDDEEEEEEEEVFQSEELIEYTAAADKETPHAHIEKEEDKKASLEKEKEDKAAASKRDKEEKAAALKRDKEEKAAALKKEKEEKKTSEKKKKTTKKNEKTEDKTTEDKTTEDKTTEERKETTEKNVVITTQDNVDLTEEEYEDEEPFPVKNFTYKGKEYLKGCGTNVIYDKDTQYVIGEWEEKTNTIYFIM